jgi:hypothetical protein
MSFLKRGLMAAGALALAAMLLDFVAPRAAHALVATAVQVMNTSATPVMIRDVDAAGLIPRVLQCTAAASDTCTTQTPPGYTFVLDSLTIYAEANPGRPPDALSSNTPPTVAIITFNAPAQAGSLYTVYIPLTQHTGPYPLRYESSATQNLTAYQSYANRPAGEESMPPTPITLAVAGEVGPLSTLSGVFVGHLVPAP